MVMGQLLRWCDMRCIKLKIIFESMCQMFILSVYYRHVLQYNNEKEMFRGNT
jgi:hypothetical protein